MGKKGRKPFPLLNKLQEKKGGKTSTEKRSRNKGSRVEKKSSPRKKQPTQKNLQGKKYTLTREGERKSEKKMRKKGKYFYLNVPAEGPTKGGRDANLGRKRGKKGGALVASAEGSDGNVFRVGGETEKGNPTVGGKKGGGELIHMSGRVGGKGPAELAEQGRQ